jgi:hypothetical protein
MSPREAQDMHYESDEESSCSTTPVVYPMKRSVSFGEIEIREYNRIVGDSNATILVGPPVSIGWDFVQRDAVKVDTFEQHRAIHRPKKVTLKMCHMQRHELLRKVFMIPACEIRAVEKEMQQMRKEARIQAKNKQEQRRKKTAEKKAVSGATSVSTASTKASSFGLFRGLGKLSRCQSSISLVGTQ